MVGPLAQLSRFFLQVWSMADRGATLHVAGGAGRGESSCNGPRARELGEHLKGLFPEDRLDTLSLLFIFFPVRRALGPSLGPRQGK